jgi:hypothetical protein
MLRLPSVLPAALRFLRLAVPHLRCHFVSPVRPQRQSVSQGFWMPVSPFRPHCRCGDKRVSQVPGEPLCTCPALLRPRWDRTRQANFSVSMLPSATTTSSAPTISGLSGLNRTACTLAVYASQHGLPHNHARLASGCWPALPGGVGYPLGSVERFQFFIISSFPRLCLTPSSFPLQTAGVVV